MRKVKIYVLLFALVFSCSSCIQIFFDKPTVTITSISASPTLQGFYLYLGMDVAYPNSYDLKLESLSFNLVVDDIKPALGQIESPVLLPAKASTYVEIPIKTDMGLIGKCISAIIQGKEMKYRIEGDALVKALLGQKSYHFSREGMFTRELLKR
jgi:LEA14-like dessication related protein